MALLHDGSLLMTVKVRLFAGLRGLVGDRLGGGRACLGGGLLRFLRGRFSEKAGPLRAVAAAFDPDGHLSQAERLAAACAAHGTSTTATSGSGTSITSVVALANNACSNISGNAAISSCATARSTIIVGIFCLLEAAAAATACGNHINSGAHNRTIGSWTTIIGCIACATASNTYGIRNRSTDRHSIGQQTTSTSTAAKIVTATAASGHNQVFNTWRVARRRHSHSAAKYHSACDSHSHVIFLCCCVFMCDCLECD
jgi:hypothetical protein